MAARVGCRPDRRYPLLMGKLVPQASPPLDTLDLLKRAQRSVLVTFGSIAIVTSRRDELRRAYATNDRVHATHDLSGLDTVEIHLNGVLDLLNDERQPSVAIRDANLNYLVLAYEVLKPAGPITAYSPLFKYFRHVRHACAHGGRITFRDRRPEAVTVSSWRGRTLDFSDEGVEVWPAYIGFPSALFLIEDALKERYPGVPDLVPRLNYSAQ